MAGNSDETAKPRGKPFAKGKSGNPSGRPKVDEEFRARCRRVTDEKCIARWEQEVIEDGPEWVRCSELLAAYGHGKPTQSVSIQDEAASMSTDELKAKVGAMLAAKGDE